MLIIAARQITNDTITSNSIIASNKSTIVIYPWYFFSCLQTHVSISSLYEFPLSLSELLTVFFLYIYIYQLHITTLYCHSFKRTIPFYFPPWTLMLKNVSLHSNAVIFLKKWIHCYFISRGVPCNVCYIFFMAVLNYSGVFFFVCFLFFGWAFLLVF